MNKKYNFTKVLVNSDNSNSDALQTLDNDNVITNNVNTMTTQEPEPAIAQQTTDNNIFDKLYMPSMGSKLTQIVRRDKSIMRTKSKFEEVNTD